MCQQLLWEHGLPPGKAAATLCPLCTPVTVGPRSSAVVMLLLVLTPLDRVFVSVLVRDTGCAVVATVDVLGTGTSILLEDTALGAGQVSHWLFPAVSSARASVTA